MVSNVKSIPKHSFMIDIISFSQKTNMGPLKIYDINDNNITNVFSDVNKFSIPHLIMKKRDNNVLEEDEIQHFITELVVGHVEDGQLGAMLMAMFIRGLDTDETTCLTRAMTRSGDILEWPKEWKGSMVDKHSTGGVGDKVSLVLAPALAACGVKVPMVSGRGLGHTGGTLDKLEAIPGYNVNFNQADMLKTLEKVGCCIVGQTSNLVPADKIMYATRDVTSTTECIGLIASSIISKKAAESLDSLVLDVKIGKGAFLKTEKDARELATRMVKAGNGSGVKTTAMLTTMDTPLGNMIGNALEVAESIYCLHGNGPDDLMELVEKLGGQLLLNAGKAPNIEEACTMLKTTFTDGTAIAKFTDMIKAQNVDPVMADKLCAKDANVFEILPKSKYTTQMKSLFSGYVVDIDAMNCANVCGKLGAGRSKAGDIINFAVGLELKTDVGKYVEKDATWCNVHHDEEEFPVTLMTILSDAIVISSDSSKSIHKVSRIVDVIS